MAHIMLQGFGSCRDSGKETMQHQSENSAIKTQHQSKEKAALKVHHESEKLPEIINTKQLPQRYTANQKSCLKGTQPMRKAALEVQDQSEKKLP